MSLLFICISLVLLMPLEATLSVAQESRSELLWSHGAPNALGVEEKDRPKLVMYAPTTNQAVGTAVVIFPGGGYGNLAMDHEGQQVAKWLNDNGIHAFVCDYRHRGKGYGHPAPLQDAQRAIRTVRNKSSQLNISSDRIGILGFSAGGHLASTVVTHFDAGDPESTDLIERFSCRPNFAVLCYPVIAFGESYTHLGSQRNLLGISPNPRLIESLSNQKRVTKKTPPTFLWHTAYDKVVPAKNSIVFFEALQAAEVPAELHIYSHGGHGMGLATGTPGAENWPADCLTWLKGQKLLPTIDAKKHRPK